MDKFKKYLQSNNINEDILGNAKEVAKVMKVMVAINAKSSKFVKQLNTVVDTDEKEAIINKFSKTVFPLIDKSSISSENKKMLKSMFSIE